MLSTKPIDASQLTFRYSGTGEHYEYDRDTEKLAKDQTRHKDTGYLLWKVRCVAVYRGRRRARRDHRHRARQGHPDGRLRRRDHVLRSRRQGLVHQRQPGPDLARRVLRRPRRHALPGIDTGFGRGERRRLRRTAAERQMTGHASEQPAARRVPRFEPSGGHDESERSRR